LSKVVKRIALLEADPAKEGEYHFKKRSEALVERWKSLFYPNEAASGEPHEDDVRTAEVATGGVAADVKEAGGAELKEVEAAPTTNGNTANGEAEPVAAAA
jgi:hypothetical protein